MEWNTTTLILYMAVFFAMMYFIAIRPQQKQAKQRQALMNSLRVRDRVITSGGIYGKIVKVKDNSIILQIADKVEIEVAKSGITSVENRDVVTENEKNKKEKSINKDEPKQELSEEVQAEKSDDTSST